jgi:hypothetical protein
MPHSNVQWHHYEQARVADITIETQLGTVFVDGRNGTPRVYVDDRDLTDAPGINLTWTYNGRYQLKLGTAILEENVNPPLNIWIYIGSSGWSMWDGYKWVSQ